MIGKIHRVKLRDVWKHEALDFSRWLEQNLDVLNEVLGLNLIGAEREKGAGDFSVDLVAEDESGNAVIIENQLEKSNHDHLGKVVTYLTSLEAKAAIWIVSDPRPEHVKAISWLNESRSAAFYLVKLEAIRIDDSVPAPLLTLITGPSREAIEAGDAKKEFAERYEIRKRFWVGLLQEAKGRTKLHNTISPGVYNWLGTSAGIQGLNWNYSVRKHDAQVELYIDRDKDSGEGNQAILNKLLEHKAEIEKTSGLSLLWESLDERRACRIRHIVPIAGWADESRWKEAYTELVSSMIKLEQAIGPWLKRL